MMGDIMILALSLACLGLSWQISRLEKRVKILEEKESK